MTSESGRPKHPTKGNPDWSDADDAILRNLWPTKVSAAEIGQRLSFVRVGNAVIGRAHRLGLGPKTGRTKTNNDYWSENDKKLLAELWPTGASWNEIAGHPGMELVRSRKAINSQAGRMGLGPKPHCPSGRKPGTVVGRAKKFQPKAAKRALKQTFRVNRSSPEQARRTRDSAIKRINEYVPPMESLTVYNDEGVLIQLEHLGPNACRWPIGDPRELGFGFCGCRTDSLYCVEHARVAYHVARRDDDTGISGKAA